MIAEPSSGGIGSRLNRPRSRFTTANEKTISSTRSPVDAVERAAEASALVEEPARGERGERHQDEVRRRAGEADEHDVAPRLAETLRVHRDRLGVPDDREAGQGTESREHERAEGIDVRDRVERQAAGALRRVVAAPERDDPVADLVEDDGDHQAAEEDDHLAEGHSSILVAGSTETSTRSRCKAGGRLGLEPGRGDLAAAGLASAVGARVELRRARPRPPGACR